MKPVMNIASEKMLLAIVKNMPQSLLLTGPDGVGLGTIAKYMSELLNIRPTIILPEKDEKIDLQKGIISIEIMRRLYNEVRTRTAGERIIIIDYAERMTVQAQNAFLKLLEEPGKGISFILVSHSITRLLPTILSRAVKFEVKPISTEQSEAMLNSIGVLDAKKRSQILYIANGLPAEIARLTNDSDYFNKRSLIICDARDLLRASQYQKLLIAHRNKDDRSSTLLLLSDAMNLLRHSITNSPNIDSINHIDAILNAYRQVEANGNIRICLARMIM